MFNKEEMKAVTKYEDIKVLSCVLRVFEKLGIFTTKKKIKHSIG